MEASLASFIKIDTLIREFVKTKLLDEYSKGKDRSITKTNSAKLNKAN